MATAAAELTDQEAKVAQMLGDAWNEYLKLPIEHPMEQKEFCSAIHACQNMVLARCGVRALKSTQSVALEIK
ncbi:hypothetical protein CJF43_07220 [Pseudomonas fragi]|jgi:hypothetical protein|uniref:Uncharacterized protein n=2 Tax=Pseudomonas TaxID=286 RepID=A0A266LY26_PSEFR|nr:MULTISPECIES: hypothetical protein [Pseudomonas]MBW3503347.1 hypothetical protein [Pseudomonas sp. NKUCC02_KPG]MCH4885520.1 hypothetical protein [Pseudomonas sp. TMW22080]OZY42195.1 hypothetical protein CJF43_07220 [Pseudomonas fragi]PAA21931.1 hypothetical protein CJU77_10775 [Pseudomonas fragi]